MAKLTDVTEKNAAPDADYLVHVVDPNDPTDDPAGTSFRMTVQNLVGAFIASLGVYFNLSSHTADNITDGTGKVLMTPAERTKLSGVASGATANQTDAHLLARANHTGTQPSSTISDFDAAADARAAAAVSTHVGLADPHTQYQKESEKGAAGGYAELDGTGKVPAAQLPSFVDDVIEASSFAFLPATGESGKIYVTLDDGKTYRWSGSAYAEISSSIAIGETSTTAYRGDRGKQAYDHSQDTTTNPHNVTKAQVGLGNVDNTSDANKPVSTATQTALDGKSNVGHTHTIANVTGLQTALDGKAPTSHSHVISEVTGLQTALDGKAATSHAHTISEVTNLQASLDAKADKSTAINAQTGTSYTLVLADAGKHVTMTNASANTLTVPPNSSVAFPVGTRVLIQQKGAGSTTVTPGSGVTINTPASVALAIGEQYGARGLIKTATDTWELI